MTDKDTSLGATQNQGRENPVFISVLGYQEEGEWVAHALEMDVIGVGGTWEKALAELDGNIRAQVSFAKYRGDDSLIFQPAPPEFFRKFEKAREAELRALVSRERDDMPHRLRSDNLRIPRDIPAGDYAVG